MSTQLTNTEAAMSATFDAAKAALEDVVFLLENLDNADPGTFDDVRDQAKAVLAQMEGREP